MTDSLETRQKIIDTCLWLRSNGYVFSTWGNVSVRLDDGNILITPSRIEYDDMKPEDLPVLSPKGKVISGKKLATSERELHRGILNKRSDIGAIIHAHSPYAMAVCALDGGIPVISEEMCQLLGGAVPISKKFVPSHDHTGLGDVVTDSIGDVNAVLIRNHGPVCTGKTLEEAKVCCQVVEKSAKMYMLLLASGQKIQVLENEFVKAGRNYFLNGYGKT